ncbi:GNAT family N-acetyltransferase [Actinopolymorpha rutila]|uniref:GNAT superfamily N-acetyltransferase n=1 Tax=Actinopolymorpha rutila TaxID=446787 RepID=A0A852ZKX4_9ACTN|nr:GNAT family N-acetyltransferase [Actinopolymorpha rutila]NYH92863.1 GNAT superfamily N-acetyltransferase [Actinopolymorpha rutila]
MGEVTIRPARLPDDLAQISALYGEEALLHTENWPDDYRTDMGASLEEELSSASKDPATYLLVAEDDSRVVGVAAAHLRPKPTEGITRFDGSIMHVADLVVTANYRRRGVGLQLMQQLETWARDQGAATVTLNVHDQNSAARELYRRRGFRAVHVQMRKELT